MYCYGFGVTIWNEDSDTDFAVYHQILQSFGENIVDMGIIIYYQNIGNRSSLFFSIIAFTGGDFK